MAINSPQTYAISNKIMETANNIVFKYTGSFQRSVKIPNQNFSEPFRFINVVKQPGASVRLLTIKDCVIYYLAFRDVGSI